MSKPIYSVTNGPNILGVLWETNTGDRIFVSMSNKIDLTYDLEFQDFATGKVIQNTDLRDLLMESFPHA